MFFSGVLFDLDNTLYSYKECHDKALSKVLDTIANDYDIPIDILCNYYTNVSNTLKYELTSTASSHSKFIYFKHIVEHFRLNSKKITEYDNQYWDIFYKNMKCFDGVIDFFLWLKTNNIKIAIITDYETKYQIKKLEILGILEMIDVIITSEEVGIEKPSKQMFLSCENKLQVSLDKCIMIGDNLEKDIYGAKNIGIISFLYTVEETSFFTFNCFKKLHTKFKDILNVLQNLETLSKYCGERFDLTQAGGGNSSVKYNDFMFIKASGYNLTQVSHREGYVCIDNKKLINHINENKTEPIHKYNIIGNERASIETYMHSMLKKYTMHLHPIQINKYLISKSCDAFIKTNFPNSKLIEYYTPGIKVCNKIKNVYDGNKIIFLKNHGIIVTSDDYEEIIELIENTLTIFEKEFGTNMEKYKYVNKISKTINVRYENVTYLCEDQIINFYLQSKRNLFLEKIAFPDALIYCGIQILFLYDLTDINKYYEKYKEYPKIIVVNNLIYITNRSLQKCKDTEDVLKSNLMILDNGMDKEYMSDQEIHYLNNWEAEKHRKYI